MPAGKSLMNNGESDRDISSADIVSFLEQGLLDNLVALFRADQSLYPLLAELLPAEEPGEEAAVVASLVEVD